MAADEQWVPLFGIAPQFEDPTGDGWVRGLSMPFGHEGLSIQLTWDEVDHSVRVRVRRAEKMVVDLYREAVDLLTVVGNDVVIEYGDTPYRGRTVVTTVPEFLVTDASMKA